MLKIKIFSPLQPAPSKADKQRICLKNMSDEGRIQQQYGGSSPAHSFYNIQKREFFSDKENWDTPLFWPKYQMNPSFFLVNLP